jgi:hypothetical protein
MTDHRAIWNATCETITADFEAAESAIRAKFSRGLLGSDQENANFSAFVLLERQRGEHNKRYSAALAIRDAAETIDRKARRASARKA